MARRTTASLGGMAALLLVLLGAPVAQGQTGPATTPDFVSVDEDAVAVVYPLLNDAGAGGGELGLGSVTPAVAGTARLEDTGVVFTPAPDWSGEAELSYTVVTADGSVAGTVFVTVLPMNDPPQAVDDTATVAVDGTVAIDVLGNDADIDGDELRIGTINSPAYGTVAMERGRIVYAPNAGYAGPDSFAYRIFDGSGESAAATVEITVGLPPAATDPPAGSIAPQPEAGSGSFAAPAPDWTAPPPAPVDDVGDGIGALMGSLWSNLQTLFLPLVLLGLVGVVAWLASQSGGGPRRKYAVVLLGRDETLPVYDLPAVDGNVIHRFDYSARQVDVVGRRRTSGGIAWMPVSTANGQGWVDSAHLTEDVARATFDADVVDRDMIQEMRRRLKEGAPLATSGRGVIDPESFSRDRSRRRLGGHATSRMAQLLGDWRASVHVDKTASLTALRPPQMRNFHWVSVEAPGRDPWQIFFEYHDGQPYPVAALPENVAVSA